MGWYPHAGAAIALELAVEKIVDDPTVVVRVELSLVTVLTTGTVLTADDDISPLVVELEAPEDVAAPAPVPLPEVSLDEMVEELTVEMIGMVVTAEAEDSDVMPEVAVESDVAAVSEPVVEVVAVPAKEEKTLKAAREEVAVPEAEAEAAAVFHVRGGVPPRLPS